MVRERLQKILARAGVASRRGAEQLIESGTVLVNGSPARLGDAADAAVDDIQVEGRLLKVPVSNFYMALNKPVGYVSSLRSTHGERTVVHLLPREPRVFPVGRLDKDTSGLLLLTDDGDWANLVTHPRYGIEKEYEVVVRGIPDADALHQLEKGVALPDGATTAAAKVLRIGDDRGDAKLSITVAEGKKRQIRLMCVAVGHPVLSLCRVRVGAISLGSLAPGQWRPLGHEEVEGIRDSAERKREERRPDGVAARKYRRSGGVG
jgi:pseudouridine synthase